MAKTQLNLTFDSSADTIDSDLISSQGSGSKDIGTVGNSDDPAVNIRLAEGEYRSEIGIRAYNAWDVGGRYM